MLRSGPAENLQSTVMTTKTTYRISFHNQGKIYEIYALDVHQSGLFGFIEVENIVFGEKTAVVVDPSEENLKTEKELLNNSRSTSGPLKLCLKSYGARYIIVCPLSVVGRERGIIKYTHHCLTNLTH